MCLAAQLRLCVVSKPHQEGERIHYMNFTTVFFEKLLRLRWLQSRRARGRLAFSTSAGARKSKIENICYMQLRYSTTPKVY